MPRAVQRATAADDVPAHGVRCQAFVLDLFREDPPVARVADRVECREPGRAMVGLVEAVRGFDVVAGAEDDVGLVSADLPADVAA